MRNVRYGLLFLTAAFCWAQPQMTPDERFVARMGQANLAVVQMSAWASDHALSDEVRKFAANIVNEHTQLADELRFLALKNMVPVGELDPKDSAEIDHMKVLEPNLLDREYMREIMKWHQREADAFKREVDAGKDQGLRYWAYQMLPRVQARMSQGEATERAIGMDIPERVAANEHR